MTRTMTSSRERSVAEQIGALAAFAAVTALVAWWGSVVTAGTSESEWFRQLDKPAFYPPDVTFSIVWTILYIMIAVAGWLAWRAGGGAETTIPWLIQLALNLGWTLIFFGAQSPAWALPEIAVLLAAAVWTATVFRRFHGVAALAFVPYILWIGFALVLNAAIVVQN